MQGKAKYKRGADLGKSFESFVESGKSLDSEESLARAILQEFRKAARGKYREVFEGAGDWAMLADDQAASSTLTALNMLRADDFVSAGKLIAYMSTISGCFYSRAVEAKGELDPQHRAEDRNTPGNRVDDEGSESEYHPPLVVAPPSLMSVLRQKLEHLIPHLTERQKEVVEALSLSGWERVTAARLLGLNANALDKAISRISMRAEELAIA